MSAFSAPTKLSPTSLEFRDALHLKPDPAHDNALVDLAAGFSAGSQVTQGAHTSSPEAGFSRVAVQETVDIPKPSLFALTKGVRPSVKTDAPPPINSVPTVDPLDLLFAQYKEGRLQTRIPRSGLWELRCPSCRQWIKTGLPISVRVLSAPNHFCCLHSHIGSRKCQNNIADAIATRRPLADLPIPTYNFGGPTHKATAAPRSRPQSTFVHNGDKSTPDSLLANSRPRGPSITSQPINLDAALPVPPKKRCPGVAVDWPGDLGPFNTTFPWHRLGDVAHALPFDIEVHDRGLTVRAWAKTCVDLALDDKECCAECAGVPRQIEDVAHIARDANPHTEHYLLNYQQLLQRLQEKEEELRLLRLWALHFQRYVGTAMTVPAHLAESANSSVAEIPLTIREANLAGHSGLLCAQDTDQVAVENGARRCHFCYQIPDNWRDHIGAHILRASRGVKEELREPIATHMPCGFCGRSQRPECAVSLKTTGRSTELECGCSYSTPFGDEFANKASGTIPCRNVPIICTLCPEPSNDATKRPATWRYNMETHLHDHHPEFASLENPTGLPLPRALWQDIDISAEEEKALGVPEALIVPRFLQVQDEGEADGVEAPGASLKRPGCQVELNGRSKRPRTSDVAAHR
ncbi:hypothetical protein B0H21DRAFT_754571 [Amylocystis lapponica]|nr:hypothetical protein B0H21DRAFT_754571 [Amylocystis lapponica]